MGGKTQLTNVRMAQIQYCWHHSALIFLTQVLASSRAPLSTLQWRHNGRDGVSNHQPLDCLLERLFRRRSKKTSKFRVTGLLAWNSPVTITRKMFNNVIMKGVDFRQLTIKTQFHNMNIYGMNYFLSNLILVDRLYFIDAYKTFINSTNTILIRINKMIKPDERNCNVTNIHVEAIVNGSFQKQQHVYLP